MDRELVDRIDLVHTGLQFAIVADKGARLLQPDFLDVIVSDAPGDANGVSPILAKLVLIANHREWETYYHEPAMSGKMSLGELASEVGREGREACGLSWTEFDLLRQSIVDGTTDYADALADLEAAEKVAAEAPSADNHLMALTPLFRLGRLDAYLENLQAAWPAVDEDPFFAILWPIKMARAFEIKGWDPAAHIDLVRSSLNHFARGGALNNTAAVIDPIDFDIAWIRCIETYFEARDMIAATEAPCEAAVDLDMIRKDEAAATLPGLPVKVAVTLTDQEMDWVELHDELCLEVLMENDDPANAWYGYEPYARGYRIRAWRRLMNMDFPNKAGLMLDVEADRSHHPTRVTKPWRERLHARMDQEFEGWDDEPGEDEGDEE